MSDIPDDTRDALTEAAGGITAESVKASDTLKAAAATGAAAITVSQLSKLGISDNQSPINVKLFFEASYAQILNRLTSP
jgi:hypothetical protein